MSASLNMILVKVEGSSRNDLIEALTRLGNLDSDFNGENGLEYMWTKVWNANGFKNMKDFEKQNEYDSDSDKEYEEISLKYESNMAYVLDMIKNEPSDKEVINAYIDNWIKQDSYYKDHMLEVIYDENGRAECIALSTIS